MFSCVAVAVVVAVAGRGFTKIVEELVGRGGMRMMMRRCLRCWFVWVGPLPLLPVLLE
jgi:H2-forming N5,N10-methylenetetrahydromethanopterin dehydrogenase-like enzyme